MRDFDHVVFFSNVQSCLRCVEIRPQWFEFVEATGFSSDVVTSFCCRDFVFDKLRSSTIRCTDEIFQALEDNQVALSTMKASHFVRAFEQEVDRWERQLSVVLEVTEMVLTVQRQWIYLEVILSW